MTRLADLHESRSNLSVQATALATKTWHDLCANTSAIPHALLDETVSEIRGIYDRLQEQRGRQLALIQEFQVCFHPC